MITTPKAGMYFTVEYELIRQVKAGEVVAGMELAQNNRGHFWWVRERGKEQALIICCSIEFETLKDPEAEERP